MSVLIYTVGGLLCVTGGLLFSLSLKHKRKAFEIVTDAFCKGGEYEFVQSTSPISGITRLSDNNIVGFYNKGNGSVVLDLDGDGRDEHIHKLNTDNVYKRTQQCTQQPQTITEPDSVIPTPEPATPETQANTENKADLTKITNLLDQVRPKLTETYQSRFNSVGDSQRPFHVQQLTAISTIVDYIEKISDHTLKEELASLLMNLASLKVDPSAMTDDPLKNWVDGLVGEIVNSFKANYENLTALSLDEESKEYLQRIERRVIGMKNDYRTGHLNSRPEGVYFGEQMQQLNINYPEVISTREDVVLASTIKGDMQHSFSGPFRFFSDHKNSSGTNLYQTWVLYNPGGSPLSLNVKNFIVETSSTASAQPNISSSKVATNVLNNQGMNSTITIPAGSYYAMSTNQHPHNSLITGYGEFTPKDGGNVQIALVQTVNSSPSLNELQGIISQNNPPNDSLGRKANNATNTLGTVKAVIDKSTYWDAQSNSLGEETLISAMGELKKEEITLWMQGGETITKHPDTARDNLGNYGCEYIITRKIKNDTDTPQKITVDVSSENTQSTFPYLLRQPFEVKMGNDTEIIDVVHGRGYGSSSSLGSIIIQPGESRDITVRFIYAGNNQPPHKLTITATEN